MGLTAIEKIISNKVGHRVHGGDIVTVPVDRVMIHDIFIPFVADKFREMGFSKIWDPDRAVLIYDHLVPASQQDDVRHFHAGDAFAQEYGMAHVHRSDGICHQLMTEAGYVKPGDICFGTDSHTTTYGCVGAFSSGVGYTEMAAILGTGTMWVKVPQTIRVEIDGKLPDGVTAKDMILTLIGDLGADGATYCALEFAGGTVRDLSVAGRMTMANMAVEAGAKCAIFSPDEKTAAYCALDALTAEQAGIFGDVDADYVRFAGGPRPVMDGGAGRAGRLRRLDVKATAGMVGGEGGALRYRGEDFVPVMACPSQVDLIRPVSELAGLPIDQVFIGSCTNGRLEDLQAAAQVLRGGKVAPFVKLIVTPASVGIYRQAIADGTLGILSEAGAIITNPGCGLCCGRTGGILSDGERVVATNNRNFLGRMGTPKVEIYLASPVTAAKCALEGRI
ncbi:MAG: 3-isopropylmalate dehydratase large subunit [Lachnospiraceae bacterium]|jgi:3-isopropylmalate/(R)-2-methylmalate dehydratase large subunit|nr:3-isopropylmalate dehydratase large subunit [Lachnospiraceae bacterium]